MMFSGGLMMEIMSDSFSHKTRGIQSWIFGFDAIRFALRDTFYAWLQVVDFLALLSVGVRK